ncbi:hypothetical protein AN219_38010 [Streptomyces nanshensis]|nr:hypothetical protein AN219_38010 [Streptomyces nanshensis]
MTLKVSAVVLLGAVVLVLVRKSGLKAGHAVVCVLLGFYLAGSSAAPTIGELTGRAAELLGRLDL